MERRVEPSAHGGRPLTARPGGNVPGTTIQDPEFAGRILQALKEALRHARDGAPMAARWHAAPSKAGLDGEQEVERAVSSPAVDAEISVQREDASGLIVRGHIDEAGVGEVHRHISVLAHEPEHAAGVPREAISDLEDAAVDIVQDRRGSAPDLAQEITALPDDSLAGDECGLEGGHRLDALPVVVLRPVEQRDDAAGVEQNRGQRPNPFR